MYNFSVLPFHSSKCSHPKLHKISSSPPWWLLNATLLLFINKIIRVDSNRVLCYIWAIYMVCKSSGRHVLLRWRLIYLVSFLNFMWKPYDSYHVYSSLLLPATVPPHNKHQVAYLKKTHNTESKSLFDISLENTKGHFTHEPSFVTL